MSRADGERSSAWSDWLKDQQAGGREPSGEPAGRPLAGDYGAPLAGDYPDPPPPAPARAVRPLGYTQPMAAAGHRPWAARALGALAGALSAGVLVTGIVLLIAQFVAPRLVPGTGISAATGPGWTRVAVGLAVGAVAEATHVTMRRLRGPFRIALDVAITAGTLAALWWVWWR